MKLIKKIWRSRAWFLFLLFGFLFVGSLYSSSVWAAELGFKAADKRMLFTIPYEVVPDVNALFSDQGERVELILPALGLKVGTQEQSLDDDWVKAFGIEKEGRKWRWYLKKRDPALRVKSFLALERKDAVLQIVLLKEYRSWSAPIRSEKPAVPASGGLVETQNSDKMARVLKVYDRSSEGGDEVSSTVDAASKSSSSLLMSGLRSLVALVFLVLVIVGISLLLKRYRRGRGGFGGSGLVKVLGVEAVSGKHQVMLLELLDEVMVIGVSGERMTLLTTINDPGKVEELRLLKDGSQSGRRFGGYLKGLLERESDSGGGMSASAPVNAVATAAYQRSATAMPETSEDLPENYQEVVGQIKDRLKNNDRSRLG